MSIIISLADRRKLASNLDQHRFRVIDCQGDCQGERTLSVANRSARASWGRGMLQSAFQAIEDTEGLSAALAAAEDLVNRYRQ